MTARELQAKIGKLCYLQASGLEILCEVTDAKTAYGQMRLQIEPKQGKGRAWVAAASVRDWTVNDEMEGRSR